MDILGQKRQFSSAYVSKEIQFWFLYQVCNSSMNYFFQKDSLDFNRDNLPLRRLINSFFSLLETFPISTITLCAVSIFWSPIHFGAWHLLGLMTAQVPTFTGLFPLMVCNTDLILHSTHYSNVSKNPHGCERMANFLQKYPHFAARQTEGKDMNDHILKRDENNLGTRFLCLSGKAGSDKLSEVTHQCWQSQERTLTRFLRLCLHNKTTAIWIYYL